MPRWLTRVQERIPLIRQSAAADSIWPLVTARSQQVWQWAAVRFEAAQQWLSTRKQAAFFATGVVVVVLLLIFSSITAAVAAVAAWVALLRHFAQTEADRQRRITESFSKAIEQLGNDKLEVRLGGIYALERISQESPHDYWTVMENLTAFVRERTRPEAERLEKPRNQRISERAYLLWEKAGRPEGQERREAFWAEAVGQAMREDPPTTDIAAVLTVIKRRDEDRRELEGALDFRGAVLRRADLRGEHVLRGAHLEHADFTGAHLEHADLVLAHLEGANLIGAHLEGARLIGAHLEGAFLANAHLEHANLFGAHLEGADLFVAHLEGADLRVAEGLTPAQIDAAFGDAATKLPEGLTRPARWPAAAKPPDLP